MFWTEVYCARLSLQSGYLAGKKRACETRSLLRKLAFTLSSPCLWQMLQRPQFFIGQGCKKPDFWNKVIENCKKYYCWKVLKSPVIILCNSTSCPHSEYMCSVCVLEQTAIIYTYRINWLVFINVRKCIYFYVVVRSESLYITHFNLSL